MIVMILAFSNFSFYGAVLIYVALRVAGFLCKVKLK